MRGLEERYYVVGQKNSHLFWGTGLKLWSEKRRVIFLCFKATTPWYAIAAVGLPDGRATELREEVWNSGGSTTVRL